jgi:hypothetical protein
LATTPLQEVTLWRLDIGKPARFYDVVLPSPVM